MTETERLSALICRVAEHCGWNWRFQEEVLRLSRLVPIPDDAEDAAAVGVLLGAAAARHVWRPSRGCPGERRSGMVPSRDPADRRSPPSRNVEETIGGR